MATRIAPVLALAALAGSASMLVAGCEVPEDEAAETLSPATEDQPAATPAATDPAATTATLRLDTLAGAGAYLTDAEGRALYLFTPDSVENAQSTCYGACAEAWPPLLTDGTPTAAAPDVRSDLIGTIQRREGTTQATYGGWPLYYYIEDAGAGTATGQDVHSHGGEWYLVTPAGAKLEREGG